MVVGCCTTMVRWTTLVRTSNRFRPIVRRTSSSVEPEKSGGEGIGHQLYVPANGRLAVAFGLAFGASRAGEIRGEDGELIRQVTFTRLVRCSGS